MRPGGMKRETRDLPGPSKPVAYVVYPEDERDTAKGLQAGVVARGIEVAARCLDDSMRFSYVVLKVHPGSSPERASIFIVCPLCGAPNLKIPSSKGIHVDPIRAERVELPGGRIVVNSISVTVEEKMTCPYCSGSFTLGGNAFRKVTRRR